MKSQCFEITSNNRANYKQLAGAQVAVLGAGRSGIALAQLLISVGAEVLLSEKSAGIDSSFSLETLKKMGVRVEVNGHSEAVLASDLVCISPGIPLTIPILKTARRRGIPVLGELEVASWFCQAPIIAITGSNGKTTTTSLAGEILGSQGNEVLVGGNIGTPLAEQVLQQPDVAYVVLEVSSFQLETIVNFRPHIAVITNLSPNHLDRYPDYAAYIDAKLNIIKNMTESDFLIYNVDDKKLTECLRETGIQKVPFTHLKSLEQGAFWDAGQLHVRWQQAAYSFTVNNECLRGPHNRYNMASAALIGVLCDIEKTAIVKILRQFNGLEHRLEPVKTINGIQFINDSKSTTVASLSYALQSFDQPVVLIAGGIDKGGKFSELDSLIRESVRAVVAIGRSARTIETSWRHLKPVYRTETFEAAIETAYKVAQKGDIVLLSPACSSFDMFRDYEERGKQFKEIIGKLSLI